MIANINKIFGKVALFTGLILTVAAAQTQAATSFALPAQPLADSLRAVGTQTNTNVLFDPDLVVALTAPALQADLTRDQALARLLSGTGLTYELLSERTAVVASVRAVRAAGYTKTSSRVPSDIRVAQSTSPPPAASSAAAPEIDSSKGAPGDITEVLVTATKREERVQDIPMSIAVIGSQDVERRGLIGMEDYLRSVPGVSQIDNGPLSNAIVIRGISTSPEFENYASAATVATYFDETPITGAAGLGAGGIDVRPVDIERIEILRGPQGTAYGSASLGGALRIIPAKPKLDGFSARVGASLGDTSGNGSENSMVQGVVNIPVVADKFALRAVGYRFDESGYYRNIAGADSATIAAAESFGLGEYVRGFVQDDIGQIVSTGGRLAGLWQATAQLDLSFNFLTQKIRQDGRPLASVGTYEQAAIPIAPQARVRGEAGEIADTDIDLYNVGLNYDLGWSTLTATASKVNGGSITTTDLFPTFTFPSSTTAPSDFESVTVETRIASKLKGRTQFLAGLYYENVDELATQTVDWPGPVATSPFGNPMLNREFDRSLDQRALFGEVSYELIDKVTGTVGGRYFKYDKNEKALQEGGLLGVPIGTGVRSNLSNSENDSSFKANIKYEPTRDALLYASWAEGFRLGRPAPGLPSALCDGNGDGLLDGSNVSIASTRSIDSDFLENYELGGKFTLLDRRMLVDAAAFHIKWDGLPITVFTSCSNIFQSYTANAGAAVSNGIELQTTLRVTEGLKLEIGGSYTKAELSKDSPGLGPDGSRLPGSPKTAANLAAQYEFGVLGHDAFVRMDSLYVGKFYGDLAQSERTLAGDYTKIDARAGVAIQNYSVEMFVRNLTNEDAFTWRGVSNASPLYGYRLRPRTVGIQVGYSFK